MKQSTRNAKILAIIGFIQIIPFTFLALIGFMGILPPIVWGLGMVLFIFYIKHAWGWQTDLQRVQKLWIYSIIFNGMGLIIPAYTAFLIAIGVSEIFSLGSIRDDELWLGAFMTIWSISIVAHAWLSVNGLRSINPDIGRELSEKLSRLFKFPEILNPK